MLRSRPLAFIVSAVVVLVLASSTLVLAEPGKGNGNGPPDQPRGKPFVQQQTATPTMTATPTVTGTPPTATPTSTATSTPTTTPTATGTPPTATPTATSTPTGTPAAIEERPGLGCGDDNHVHTGAPGNPSVTCPSQHDDTDEDATEDTDAS